MLEHLVIGYFLTDHGDSEVGAEWEADGGSGGGADVRERGEMGRLGFPSSSGIYSRIRKKKSYFKVFKNS